MSQQAISENVVIKDIYREPRVCQARTGMEEQSPMINVRGAMPI